MIHLNVQNTINKIHNNIPNMLAATVQSALPRTLNFVSYNLADLQKTLRLRSSSSPTTQLPPPFWILPAEHSCPAQAVAPRRRASWFRDINPDYWPAQYRYGAVT